MVSQPTGRNPETGRERFLVGRGTFPRNTKYCFNGPNIGYFVIKIEIYPNVYILNTLRSFLMDEEVKTGLKRLPNGIAFLPRPKNCRLW